MLVDSSRNHGHDNPEKSTCKLSQRAARMTSRCVAGSRCSGESAKPAEKQSIGRTTRIHLRPVPEEKGPTVAVGERSLNRAAREAKSCTDDKPGLSLTGVGGARQHDNKSLRESSVLSRRILLRFAANKPSRMEAIDERQTTR